MTAQERIFAWAWDASPNRGQWESFQSIVGEGTEYIRADLHDAEVARLRDELEELRDYFLRHGDAA